MFSLFFFSGECTDNIVISGTIYARSVKFSSLYRKHHYIEDRYIGVPLYHDFGHVNSQWNDNLPKIWMFSWRIFLFRSMTRHWFCIWREMFFKVKTGNVQTSFPNDQREVRCPYLTQGSAQHPFQFPCCLSIVNTHKYSFFVRTVPAWNALSPTSVCAHSVAAFHSSICNKFMFRWFFTSNFICIYLFFCFTLFIYFAVNVMSFRVLTFHCQINSLSLEVIKSIKH